MKPSQYKTMIQTITRSIVSCFQRQYLIQKTSLHSDCVYSKTILTEFKVSMISFQCYSCLKKHRLASSSAVPACVSIYEQVFSISIALRFFG